MHINTCRDKKGTQKKSELHTGIKPTTFHSLAGHSTTESQQQQQQQQQQ